MLYLAMIVPEDGMMNNLLNSLRKWGHDKDEEAFKNKIYVQIMNAFIQNMHGK